MPRPQKAALDSLLLHFESQMAHDISVSSPWPQQVFQISPDDFSTLEGFLSDFHTAHPDNSMAELMRTFNALLQKLLNIEAAYRFLGCSPAFDEFKDVLMRLQLIRDQISLWRMVAAGHLAILTGQKPPCIETTANVKDAMKLYEFVKWYAMGLGYRIGGPASLVYIQDTCMYQGQLHKTPHWRHAVRIPQPGALLPLGVACQARLRAGLRAVFRAGLRTVFRAGVLFFFPRL